MGRRGGGGGANRFCAPTSALRPICTWPPTPNRFSSPGDRFCNRHSPPPAVLCPGNMESYGTCGAETYGSSEQQPILQRYASANPDLLPRGRVLTDVSDPNHVAKVVRYKSTHLARWGVVDVRMIGSTLFSSVAVWVKLLLFSLVGAGVFCFAEVLSPKENMLARWACAGRARQSFPTLCYGPSSWG